MDVTTMSSSYGVLLKDPTFHATVPKDLPRRVMPRRRGRPSIASVTRHASMMYRSVLFLCPGRDCCGLISPIIAEMVTDSARPRCEYCRSRTIYPMAPEFIQLGTSVFVDQPCANVECANVFTTWTGHPLSSKWCHKCRKTHSR